MTDHEQWLQANDAYLADAIHWLHLRLEHLIEAINPPAPSEPAKKYSFKKVAPEPNANVKNTDLEKIAEKMAAAEASSPPPALVILQRHLGLTRFESNILLLCVAMELDGRTASLCAKAQDNPYKPYPTFALALKLFEQAAWDAISPDRPLRYWRLLDINQPGAEPLATSALRADEHIVNYLVEPKHKIDDRLMPFVAPINIIGNNEIPLAPSQLLAAQTLLHYLQAKSTEQRPLIVQLTGRDELAKQAVSHYALSQLGLQMIRFPVETLPTQTGDIETLTRLWGRELHLQPYALYLDAGQSDSHDTAASLKRLLANCGGITLLATNNLQTDLFGLSLEIDKPSSAEQQDAWIKALGAGTEPFAAKLAGQFNLDIASIIEISRNVPAEQPDLQQAVWKTCALKTSPKLDQLAQRIDVKASWDDIVLPKAQLSLLQQITGQVDQRGKVYNDWGFAEKMNRGLGLSVLFAGDSGTGKTMAAEVIANALNLNLYRIDLSAVVSKYIGETEKNLRKLFDAAEDGGAVLFFDEADALFGKRSEVKDSHDRYANIEINYLLQRIESYRGLAILATNMKSSLDDAFTRRLRFIVNFPFPGLAERKEMWRKVFPKDTPTAELDYDRLARFNLTGGNVHNIALNAAFLAARKDPQQVTTALIFEAIRGEYGKLDKPINEAEFRVMEVVGSRP